MFFLTMNRRRFYLVVVAERFCRRYAKRALSTAVGRGQLSTVRNRLLESKIRMTYEPPCY